MNLETDAELPQAEESIPEVTMEQKPNEGPSDSMKDDLEVSSSCSNVCFTSIINLLLFDIINSLLVELELKSSF